MHALGTDIAILLFLGSLIMRKRDHYSVGTSLGLAGMWSWQERAFWAGTWRSIAEPPAGTLLRPEVDPTRARSRGKLLLAEGSSARERPTVQVPVEC